MVSPFAPMVEPGHHRRKLHDSRDQVQDISWAIGRPDKQTNIKIAPAHQVGDVACMTAQAQRLFREGYEHRPVDRHDLDLLEEWGRASTRLSGC